VSLVADVVDIARTHALLHVAKPRPSGVFFTQQIGHEGVHPCRREKDGRVVLGDERGGRDNLMPLLLEEFQIHFSQTLSSMRLHNISFVARGDLFPYGEISSLLYPSAPPLSSGRKDFYAFISS